MFETRRSNNNKFYYFISRVCVQYVGCQDIYGCCGTFFEKIISPTLVLIHFLAKKQKMMFGSAASVASYYIDVLLACMKYAFLG